MGAIPERRELRRLVDGMTDEQVRVMLDAARQIGEVSPASSDGDGLAWIGCITNGPEDLSVRKQSR